MALTLNHLQDLQHTASQQSNFANHRTCELTVKFPRFAMPLWLKNGRSIPERDIRVETEHFILTPITGLLAHSVWLLQCSNGLGFGRGPG